MEEGKGDVRSSVLDKIEIFSSKHEMKCSTGNCNFETTTTLMAENKEELKSLLMKVKECCRSLTCSMPQYLSGKRDKETSESFSRLKIFD